MPGIHIVLLISGALILAGALFIYLSSRPLTKEQAETAIQKLLDREVNNKKNITQGLLLADSPEKNFREFFVSGELKGRGIDSSQPFHVASVGKSFTATLIGMFVDDGLLDFDDRISQYLDQDLIDPFNPDITIRHLLSHTSGLADYFEDEVVGSDQMAELVVNDPDHFWTAEELVRFTGRFQQSIAPPGEGYHYSDTGYILLGLILESISGNSFHDLLHRRIFSPLNMNDSYLAFYSDPVHPKRPLADIWFRGTNIKDHRSLSMDWAGGGIISTLNDLAIFIRALNKNQLLSDSVLKQMYCFENRFIRGIYYGLGFMEYHFTDYFPTLSFLPRLRGHMGILGTQMLYDKSSDTVYVCSFGSTDYSAGSVKTMITVLSYIHRIKAVTKSRK